MRSSSNTLRGLCALGWLFAAAACAHGQPVARSTPAFRAFDCPAGDDGHARAFGDALKLALDVDYLEVVSHGGGHDQMVVVERGTKCSGASNPAACSAELARLTKAWVVAQQECDDCDGATLIMTTRKDEVAQWAQPDLLPTLLGAIDSPADAWLLLMMRTGYPPYACGDASASGYRVVAEGIELVRREWVTVCRPIERVEIVELFESDGSVTPLRRTVIEHEADGCIRP